MTTFSERLKELRLNLNLKQSDLAQNLILDRTSISKYENGKQIPETPTLEKLADFFNVSVDYLLGKTNIKNPNIKHIDKLHQNDIKKAIASTLEQLENAHDGLMFDGEPIDDETKELLIMSLERSMRLAKQLSKEKNK